MLPKMPDVTIVGVGKVGTHLATRFTDLDWPPMQLFGRRPEQVMPLADKLGTEGVSKYAQLLAAPDLLILAVNDDAIESVAATLSEYINPDTLVVHTSGSVPGEVLAPYFSRYGVFYPLQSFSPEQRPAWEALPLLVHASTEKDLEFLEKTARYLCPNVHRVNDTQRAQLHLAAVWVNNFSNHCFAIGYQLCEEQGVPFDLLRPLLAATAQKALNDVPAAMQTGPAIRHDQDIIEKHLQQLKEHPNWQSLYQLLTESIQKMPRE